jgi:hypothetical protein
MKASTIWTVFLGLSFEVLVRKYMRQIIAQLSVAVNNQLTRHYFRRVKLSAYLLLLQCSDNACSCGLPFISSKTLDMFARKSGPTPILGSRFASLFLLDYHTPDLEVGNAHRKVDGAPGISPRLLDDTSYAVEKC